MTLQLPEQSAQLPGSVLMWWSTEVGKRRSLAGGGGGGGGEYGLIVTRKTLKVLILKRNCTVRSFIYLDPGHTPPWCWQSEVWSRSCVAPVVADPPGWRGSAHWWCSRRRLSCSGCRGSGSSSSSPGQTPPTPSPASFPDVHLREKTWTIYVSGSYMHIQYIHTWE